MLAVTNLAFWDILPKCET